MADFFQTRTFTFEGLYRDARGEEAITVASDGRYLYTTIRGVRFEGNGLYALHVAEEDASKDLGALPLTRDGEELCDCYLSMTLPVRLWQADGERDLPLLLAHWNGAEPEEGAFASRSVLSCTVGGKRHEVDGESIYNGLWNLTRILDGEGAHLRCCFTCRLSCYEPFERPQFGEVLCYRGMKAEFLGLDLGRPKQDFYAHRLRERADEYVTEAHLCKEYVPQVRRPTRQVFPSPGFEHYWTEGHGPVLLKKLPKVPTREEVDAESFKLLEFDALGDEVVRDVYQTMDFEAAGELMDRVLREGIGVAAGAPASLQRMMAAAETPPDWVDWAKVELGAQFCRRSGSFGLIVLRNYCLMGGYESSAINKPLIATGALKKGAAKRMAETVEFWVNATGAGAMRPHAAGYRAAIKVRLMHAYARVAVRASGTWDSHAHGEPINQWDMVATNLGFSLAYLDGLRSLGFRPGDAEVEGLLHFWKYVGYLLGIPPHYLPDTEVEAIRTLYHWTITQPPADDDTRTLARALMDEPLSSRYLPFIWMKRMLCKTHLAYNHFFLGERSCTAMGLPGSRIKWHPKLVRGIQGAFQSLVNRSPRLHRLSVRMGRRSQLRIMNMFLGRPANAEVE